ncbi:MAG TPA: ATP-grasp domain-containing protein [Blastocatellia bacterium]|jgi:predicted ATP-grasp superfamily ATP-dependent carboligase|nr:ATP-grasp domain-containing protein [Blastocatellia bacterium]
MREGLRAPKDATILVTDSRRGSAIAVIRSLGRRGWRVIAADSLPSNPGFSSRYVRGRLVYSPPETAPGEFIDDLLRAAREKAVDLIIPVTDDVILPLSAARSRFDGVCKLALPRATSLDVVTNKLKTIQLAAELGVPTPLTRLVHSTEEALDQARSLGWPLVLKPLASRLYRDRAAVEAFEVSYAENRERLTKQMRLFEGKCPVLLQEYYRGVGYGVELLMHEGRPLSAFQHKRLREIPINGGASTFRQSVPLDPDLYRHSIRLLQNLRWTGLAMVEFKVGRAGARLMEINGRVWGSLPLAVHSGVDFPVLLAEMYLSGPPDPQAPPAAPYKAGIRSRSLLLDMVWIGQVLLGHPRYPFLEMPSRRQALTALLQLLNPAYKFDIQSLDDPQPGIVDIFNIVGRFAAELKKAM